MTDSAIALADAETYRLVHLAIKLACVALYVSICAVVMSAVREWAKAIDLTGTIRVPKLK